MRKIIHYCWFGSARLPESATLCIESWKKYFPDYEIKEWNESNYDVNKILYTRQAYKAKKYAFVSDYARFDILYQEGGIYFDTDVEVIKPFDDILEKGAFMGCEIDGSGDYDGYIKQGFNIAVAPGLGIAVNPGLGIYKKLLDMYSELAFINDDGSLNTKTVVFYTTEILKRNGLRDIPGIQNVGGINIYPKEYLCPYDYRNGVLAKTVNTHSIHWNSMSWASKGQVLRSKITRIFHRYFGNDCFRFLKK